MSVVPFGNGVAIQRVRPGDVPRKSRVSAAADVGGNCHGGGYN